jgi:hypothetical protein
MHLDITCSMIIYTIATIAFYLLGAGVLNSMGLVPAAKDMISVLSNIYTQILGPWSLWLFYLGAIATLYGTIFASTASNSRVFADLCRMMGAYDRHDYAKRVRYRQIFVVILTVIPAILVITVQSPVTMVVVGGIAQSLMLPILGVAAVYLRHKRLPKQLAPSGFVTAALWVCAAVMATTVGYALIFGR